MEFEKYLPHLKELRNRTLRCVIAFIIILIPLLYFSRELYTFAAEPILQTFSKGGQLIATQVMTPFTAPLKLSLFAALFVTIPFILYNLWAFVAPGLYTNEKRTIKPILLLSTFLFYAGVLFAHTVVLPIALGFFSSIAPEGVSIMTDIQYYLDFILSLYFAFGLAFQVPIITFLLIHAGIVSVTTLQKHRRYYIVGAFVVGMVLTPPDVVSQILLAVPLLILFEAGLWLAKWVAKPVRKIEKKNSA
ncbi:MAG: twin-arginine translocase subunit TatC [Candidatus Berkiellales bacterium]